MLTEHYSQVLTVLSNLYPVFKQPNTILKIGIYQDIVHCPKYQLIKHVIPRSVLSKFLYRHTSSMKYLYAMKSTGHVWRHDLQNEPVSHVSRLDKERAKTRLKVVHNRLQETKEE
ncbi:TPA: ProQ/FINO family protein [Vibrio harveyi]|uniref:ProQ/FINO family protein n=1 Tax=Vibrio harveyi TaxID=669 RepID=UPI00390AD827